MPSTTPLICLNKAACLLRRNMGRACSTASNISSNGQGGLLASALEAALLVSSLFCWIVKCETLEQMGEQRCARC